MMSIYPAEFLNGILCVNFGPKERSPVLRGGQPVTSLLPGWNAVALYPGIGGVRCLFIRHDSGDKSVWYLDERLNYITNRFLGLSHEQQAGFRRSYTSVMDRIISQYDPSMDEKELAIDPASLDFIIDEYAQTEQLNASYVVLGSEHEGTTTSWCHGQFELTEERIRSVLSKSYMRVCRDAIVDGEININSPFSDKQVKSTKAFHLSATVYAYRFYDSIVDQVFYVFASAWKTQFLALYIPRLDFLVHLSRRDQVWLQEWLGGEPREMMRKHVWDCWHQIIPYLRNQDVKFSIVYHQEHLGHHLWNELTGLEKLIRLIPPHQPPMVIMLNSTVSEMWGKLDALFPELDGRVIRAVEHGSQLVRQAYPLGLTFLRPCDDYVSRDLARRILEVTEAEVAGENIEYDALRAGGYRIVTLGLRVENRTIVDLERVFIDLIEFLRSRVDRLAVIIDGHNSASPETSFKSHGEHLAEQSPVAVEENILENIRGHFSGYRNIEIISTLGKPIGASLFWCSRSEFFVTPWGAGLAKYRWVCNVPGLITAGPNYIQTSGDLHLYDAERYMEAPTPVYFNDIDAAEDVPDAPLLVGLPHPHRWNYSVEKDSLFALVDRLLERE